MFINFAKFFKIYIKQIVAWKLLIVVFCHLNNKINGNTGFV